MWEVAARALVLGVNVILDYGWSTRSERDAFRTRARDLGADFVIHFADAPEDVLLERLRTRNTESSERTFSIPESKRKV